MKEQQLTETGSRYSPAQTQQVRSETIRSILTAKRELLTRNPVRTDLRDCEAVRAVADAYLEHCAECSLLPSFVGLSAALGMSRMYLYRFLDQNRESETGQFLEQLRSLFTDARISAADRNAAPESLTIFLLKNGNEGFTDRVELAPGIPDNPLHDLDAEVARKRLLDAIPDEDDL